MQSLPLEPTQQSNTGSVVPESVTIGLPVRTSTAKTKPVERQTKTVGTPTKGRILNR